EVANCASCHGVHNILPSDNPQSLVHAGNIAETCGKCHEGAGELYDFGPVHVTAADKTNNIVAYWIRAIYIPLIWVVVVGMLLHNLIDLIRKTRDHEPRLRLPPAGAQIRERMSGPFRVAHGVAALSFVVLVVSGFALKYPESAWAWPFRPYGGEGVVRGLVHRVAAVGLMGALGFHLLHLVVSRRARGQIAAFLPKWADLTEIKERIGYNLGLRPEPPAPVRVGYAEKLEYWAALWGTVITAGTGLLLWFENYTLARLPGWVPEAATALHLYEAILAALSILVWHFYFVLLDPVIYPMDTTWLTGKPPFERARERGEVISEENSETFRT
ncbi:MAG: cytochrome b/b6 domain-containing protein, partial [Gammaproteobacteria bacterium]|nr:cytochrome b/b6 domain-containing protein [Gammaproteobacteria bacterium]